MSSPAIRFAGFTEDWEQRKLGGLGRVSTGNTPPTSENDNWSDSADGHVWITPTDINACLMSNSVRHLTDIGWTIARVVPAFSVLITSIASIGKNAVNTIPVAFNQQINAIVPEGNDAYFILSAMEKCKERFAGTAGQTATAIINKTEFEKFSLSIPSVQEQQQVGGFFFSLDRLITLHQREHDKTVNIKKALLEKMFPKDGEDKPEIRFAGFTGAWEQRRVGEFYFFKNGLNKSKEYFGKGTPIINFTDVFHNRGLKAKQLQGKVLLDDNEIKNFEVRQGDIFFTRTSETIDEIGYPSVMLDTPESTVFSGFVLRGRAIEDDPMTNIFKRYVFFTQTFRSEMIKKSSMTTRALTSGTAIKEMCFNFPVSKKEQEQIGLFFANLDRLIALHQRELTKLQNIKKALLEKMFV